MGTKSGFLFRDLRWLIAEPHEWFRRDFLTDDEMFEPVWSTRTETGLTIAVTAGQLLIVDFREWAAAQAPSESEYSAAPLEASIAPMRVRVQVANALALSIHSSALALLGMPSAGFRVTHEDLLHFHSSGNGVIHGGQLVRVPGRGLLMPRERSGVIPERVVQQACQLLDQLVTHSDKRTLDLIELLNTSLVACRGHDFGLATVAAWSVCEAVLGEALHSYARDQATTHDLVVNRRRRRQWDDLPAATTIEILSLAGVIPSALEERLRVARIARNSWIHTSKPVPYAAAVDAVLLAGELLASFGWPSLRLAPNVGVQGLGI